MRLLYPWYFLFIIGLCYGQKADTLVIFFNKVEATQHSICEKSSFKKTYFSKSLSKKIVPAESLIFDTLSDGRIIYRGLPKSYDKEPLEEVRNYRDGHYQSSLSVENTFNPLISEVQYYFSAKFKAVDIICYGRFKSSPALMFYFYNSSNFFSESTPTLNSDSNDVCKKEGYESIKPCPRSYFLEDKIIITNDALKNYHIVEFVPFSENTPLKPYQVNQVDSEFIQMLQNHEYIYIAFKRSHQSYDLYRVGYQYDESLIPPCLSEDCIEFNSLIL